MWGYFKCGSDYGREMNEIRDLKDSLDSIHQRMDRFYAWASQLQVEMRNTHQRLKFLENTLANSMEFNGMSSLGAIEETKPNEKNEEDLLLERLNRFKQQPNQP